jgi:hypothetical protein
VFEPPTVGNDSTAPELFFTDSTSLSLKKIVPLPAAGVGTDPAVFCFNINISYYPILNVVLLRMIIFI